MLRQKPSRSPPELFLGQSLRRPTDAVTGEDLQQQFPGVSCTQGWASTKSPMFTLLLVRILGLTLSLPLPCELGSSGQLHERPQSATMTLWLHVLLLTLFLFLFPSAAHPSILYTCLFGSLPKSSGG